MADAKVQYTRYPGGGVLVPPEEAQAFWFRCPKYDRMCGPLLIAGRNHGIPRNGQNENGGKAQWDMKGTPEAPTFTPSVDCKGCWHGFIENGRTVSCAKTDEPEPKGSN